ncbi:MAG: molybdenum cofactor guanylyltransferase [Kiritimatiellae bacterium]|nr:molybdenum cofactor guanylyltransferase [Kiritimatiellia bacterium]
MPQSPTLTGLVLAGGKSRRMGRDKALLEFHGKPQALVAAEMLRPHVDEVYLSCRPDQYADDAFSGLPRLTDPAEGMGPMGGMLAAFLHKPDAAWLVLACDLPLLTPETLDTLLRGREPGLAMTAFVSAFDGLPEPLCTIYEPAALPFLEAARDSGHLCPRKILIRNPEQVKLLKLPEGNPLDNINAPEDLERNGLSI